MKKILSVVFAVLMIASCVCVASAADTKTTINQDTAKPQSADVTVKTVKTDGSVWYEVSIPANTNIAWGSTSAVDMGYEVACQLEGAQKLTVTIKSANDNKFVNTTLGEIKYTQAGFDAKTFNTVTGTKAAPVKSDATITVPEANWQGIAIGEYSDTLTYTVSVA